MTREGLATMSQESVDARRQPKLSAVSVDAFAAVDSDDASIFDWPLESLADYRVCSDSSNCSIGSSDCSDSSGTSCHHTNGNRSSDDSGDADGGTCTSGLPPDDERGSVVGQRRRRRCGLRALTADTGVSVAVAPNCASANPSRSKGSAAGCSRQAEDTEPTPWLMYYATLFSYFVLYVFGTLRDALRRLGLERVRSQIEEHRAGYAPLYRSFDAFYTRNIYRPIRDCWNLPLLSVPGAHITLRDRVSDDYNWTFRYLPSSTTYVNLGSYNYLGFAENCGECADRVEECITHHAGYSLSSTRHELGTHALHVELEQLVADFLGVDAAIVVGMGFATNSTNIPALVGPGCLIVSDELNHASLCLGCKLSGATIRRFRHNDMVALERVLEDAVVTGQPNSGVPWRKIVIIVEGIYSMEGTIIDLPTVIALKHRYKTYLYLDEAHSIGALGPRGRGVVDYFNADPRDVDLLMGTFTKSFGAAGGYIAGGRQLIDYLRATSYSFAYATPMAPPVAQQVIAACRQIMSSAAGGRRLRTLARNTRYFRRRLRQMGFIVYGHDDSPVVPLMLYLPSKIAAFVRHLLADRVATVGVGYPATPLTESRVRFCLSAAHTRDMLDYCLDCIDRAGDRLHLKLSRRPRDSHEIIEY